MKKTLLSTALVAVVAAVAMPSAFAATGKITINGVLRAGTCTVTPTSGASGSAADMVVTLPGTPAGALSAADSFAETTPFKVLVGGGASDTCNDQVTHLNFENTSGSLINADGYLDNSATGTATKVGVRLLNGDTHATINLANPSDTNNPVATPVSGTPGVLNYQAQYYSKTGGATAGTVNTYVMYTVSY
ncbi:fimbrial protein [Lysobacter soli]|uniref:fimbrial protein n=1 Tax=Lysobacter soli TaxID=453783 RepID=UPI0036BE7CEB